MPVVPIGLEEFFAPAGPSQPGGVGGPPATAANSAAPLTDVDPARLDNTIPTRREDPDLWDTAYLSEIPLPPVGTGQAVVKFKPRAKVDKKAGAGKKAPRVTVAGAEPTDGTIEITAGPAAWPAIVAASKSLVPGSGPFPLRHPKATLANAQSVMVEGWEDAPDLDEYDIVHWTINVTKYEQAAQTGAGGKGVAAHKDTPACRQLRTEYANLLGEQQNLLSGINGDPLHDAAIHLQNLQLQTAISEALIALEVQGCNRNAGAPTTTPKTVTAPTYPGDPGSTPAAPEIDGAFADDKATAGEDGSAP
jgi:hypothetical protein